MTRCKSAMRKFAEIRRRTPVASASSIMIMERCAVYGAKLTVTKTLALLHVNGNQENALIDLKRIVIHGSKVITVVTHR